MLKPVFAMLPGEENLKIMQSIYKSTHFRLNGYGIVSRNCSARVKNNNWEASCAHNVRPSRCLLCCENYAKRPFHAELYVKDCTNEDELIAKMKSLIVPKGEEEFKRLSKEFPLYTFRMTGEDNIIQRDFSLTEIPKWGYVCCHARSPNICCNYKFCEEDTKKHVVHRLRMIGPLKEADSIPFFNRIKEDAPNIPLDKSEEEIQKIQARLKKLGKKKGKDCIVHRSDIDGSYQFSIKIGKKSFELPQAAWMMFHKRKIPPGFDFVIRHKCQTKGCYNPKHLQMGTRFENSYDDQIRDGTFRTGEDHHATTISNELALKVFQSKNLGTIKQRAKEFGIHPNLVKGIDGGTSFSYVTKVVAGFKRARCLPKKRKPKRERSSATDEDYEDCYSRIMKRVKKDPITNCFNCTFHKDGNGYAQVSMLNRMTKAHIVVCEYFHNNKKISPAGMMVCHSCNNKSCVNPKHLRFGTASDNVKDMWRAKKAKKSS